MLEDSISSSPSKSNKSIRETRLKRKIKRKQAGNNEPSKSDHTHPTDLQSLIKDFYLDSDDETTANTTFLVAKTPAIVNNYRPFELEKSLALADRLSGHQPNNNKTNFMPPTEGFVSCINLTQIELETGTRDNLNKKSSSFSITESEIINCCNLAEQNIQSTPKKDDMFLVNSILEDFSQSPISKEAKKQHSPCQHTPEFRLRRKPIKTYSRTFLNRSKRNLNARFVAEECITSSDEDDDGQTNSSSLSIQEDITMGEIVTNQPNVTSLHNTRLCENLLNLSVYFTQNPSQENIDLAASLSADQEDHVYCSNVAYLIKDIISLRSMCHNDECYDVLDTTDGFQGFPCAKNDPLYGNIDVDSTEHNSIHTTLNIEQELSVHNDKELDTSVFGEDWNDEDCEDIFAGINTENILDQQNCEQLNVVSNNGEFSTPLHLINNTNTEIPNEIPVNKIGFTTASSKPIKVSRDAHIIAAKILSNLPEVPSMENEENVKNCDNKPLQDNNIFENLEEDEWNDDCDLLNFQTPIAKTTKTTKITTKTQDSKSQLNVANTMEISSLGFKTAGGKNVVISRRAQESVQNLLKEFDNDIKDNYNCEETLKEMKCKVYAKTHNLEINDVNVREYEYNVKTLHETGGSSTSKLVSVGFQTADGKNVHVSRKAQESVQNLLNEFDNNIADIYNCEEALNEMKNKVYANTHDNSIGFKTAGGKSVNISKKAQESVQNLLKEFSTDVEDNYNCEEKLKEMKNKVYAKTHSLEFNQVKNSGRETTISNELTKTENENHQLEFEGPSTSKMASLGFKTAGGKNVNISKKAQQSVQQLLKEFSNDLKNNYNYEENLKEIKNKVYAKTHKTKTKDNNESENTKNIKDIKKEYATSTGFQTAKGSKIITSAKAQESVSNLLKDFVEDTNKNYLNDLEAAKNEIYNKNNKLKDKKLEISDHNEDLSGIMLSEWPLEKSAEINKSQMDLKDDQEIETLIENDSENVNTKEDQQIVVSTKDQPIEQNLLQQSDTGVNMEKTKLLNKQQELKIKSSHEHKELAVCNKNLSSKSIKCKRKYSIDNSELNSPHPTTSSPPAKLQNTRSSLVEHSLKSPLNLASSHIAIGRKNLSLTKRLRNKRTSVQATTTDVLTGTNNEDVNLNQDIATPIKSCIASRFNKDTPNTPNLKEFFSEAALTSTPRLNQATTSAQIIDEQDFKPIDWKNNESVSNKSINNHTTKLSDSSGMNISLNSSNPTAKERIGRLKMYGKAPPVSPILIEPHQNCRPLGLRRTRSMLKK